MSQCVNTVLDGTHQEDVDNRIAKMEKENPLHTPLCFSKLNYDLHCNLDLPDGIESYSWNFFFQYFRATGERWKTRWRSTWQSDTSRGST